MEVNGSFFERIPVLLKQYIEIMHLNQLSLHMCYYKKVISLHCFFLIVLLSEMGVHYCFILVFLSLSRMELISFSVFYFCLSKNVYMYIIVDR